MVISLFLKLRYFMIKIDFMHRKPRKKFVIKMSNNIPLEIQTEIMKRLPVKSLLRFRSVSKSCKSLIDSSDFIKHYIGQQQHLLVRCYDCVAHFEKQPMSIVDDDSLPTQTASVTLPSLVEYPNLIGTSHGLFCFYGPSSGRGCYLQSLH
ncbi:putative F-box domain-containing protein [Helianthus annuus]|nr:putative F-box domain-containing protein [Helianthus annuus]